MERRQHFILSNLSASCFQGILYQASSFLKYPQVEDEDTVTGARVVDGDDDEDDQGVESILGRSKLRAAAEGDFLKSVNI